MLGKAVFRDFSRVVCCALFALVVSFLPVFDTNAAAAPAFSVTTTSLSAGDTFTFNISATGTFSVDCGAGGTLSGTGVSGGTIIDRSSITTNDTYTCSYSSGSVKTISFDDGYSATGYNTDSTMAAISFKNNTYVKVLNGDLSLVFPEVNGQYPSFYETFSGCSNLTIIPSTFFAHITFGKANEFKRTFSGCTGLTSLPSGLFSSVDSSNNSSKLFEGTFSGCTGLTTIPGDLFSGITTGADSMFWGTFHGCTGLTLLPDGLFSHIVNVSNTWYLFAQTFSGCTGLTTIPGDLFGGITTGANSMFDYTFSGCTHLTSIPPNLFSNITTSAAYMFSYTFSDCTGLQSIPEGLFDGITTGAESMFSNTFLRCSGLKYLPNGLFSKITTPAKQMFMETFRGCSDLGRNSDPAKNFIPSTFFKGLVDNGSPTASQFMHFMFYQSNLLTQCPENYYQYTTGYESDWPSKVSCEQCPNGKVSPAGSTDINQCARRAYVFSLNTTGLNVNDTFKFLIAAKGTFFIDCGTDGVLTSSANDLAVLTDGGYRVVRTYANNATTYTCTYSTEGPKTIQFGGEATEYSNFAAIRFNIGDSNNANVKKIASISGSLGQIFGTVANLPASSGQPKFLETFHDATNMTGTIPPTLFDGVSGAPTLNMFNSTFSGCSGLTGVIPSGLFGNLSGAPAINMFNSTFSGCSGLTGFGDKTYVPKTFLENITTDTSVSYQTLDMFTNTQLDRPCPAGTYDVTREQFNDAGKPWCAECPSGYTSPAGSTSISQCQSGQTITPTNPTTYTVTYHSGNCHPEHQTDYTNTTHSVPDSVHPATGDTYTVNMDVQLSPLFVEFNNMNFPTGDYDTCATFLYWEDDYGNTYNYSTNVSNPVIPTIAPYGSSDTNLYARCYWYPIEVGFYPGTCSGNVLREEKGTYGTSFSMPSASTANISVPANYHFSGWSNNSNATSVDYEVDDTYTIDVCVYTNDKNDEPYIKFYAVCSPDTYNINYHNVLNSDTWTGNHPNTYTYGVGASVGVPSRTGYTFLGWCVNNSNCSNYANYMNGYTISASSAADINLYAMWEQNSSNIVNLTWIVNGQEYNSNPSSCEYGTGTIGNIQHQEIPGWTFTGWKVTNWTQDCGISRLDPNTRGTWYAYKYTSSAQYCDYYEINTQPSPNVDCTDEHFAGLNDDEWQVNFGYGMIKGSAYRSAKGGDNHNMQWGGNSADWTATQSDLESATGEKRYCWCKVTNYTPTGDNRCDILTPSWVFALEQTSVVNCANYCAIYVSSYKNYRVAMFGIQ